MTVELHVYCKLFRSHYKAKKQKLKKYKNKKNPKFVSWSAPAFMFFATNDIIYIFYLVFYKNQNQIIYFEVELEKKHLKKNWQYFPEIWFLVRITIISSAFEHWNMTIMSLAFEILANIIQISLQLMNKSLKK